MDPNHVVVATMLFVMLIAVVGFLYFRHEDKREQLSH